MKSRVLLAPRRGEVEFQEVEVGPPGPGQIQVRMHASLVSPGTERAFITGMENTSGTYPWEPGYCAAGTVAAVGPDVTRFKPGDRVGCLMTHRSLGNLSQERTTLLPADVSFEQAAFLTIGLIAFQGVRKARIELGESALVFGLGIIGQFALQLTRLDGAFPAIGVDRVAKRMEVARQCGADLTLDTSQPNWMDSLKQATGGTGPQVVIEATGSPTVINDALTAAGEFGRVVLLGSTRGISTVNFYQLVHVKGTVVIGAHTRTAPKQESRPGYWTWDDNARVLVRLMQSGRINTRALTTERVKAGEVLPLYRDMLAGKLDMIGTLIDWT